MELQPFDPYSVAWRALLDPFVIAVAFLLGQRANQWQKLIVAAFAAALIGYIGLWLTTFVGLFPIKGVGAATGVFMLQFLFGLVWAFVGYKFFPVVAAQKASAVDPG